MVRFLLAIFVGSFPFRTVAPVGHGWISTGPPGYVKTIRIDPWDPSIVFSVVWTGPNGDSSGIFRRASHGRGWDEIAQAPAGFSISDLVVDPADPSTLVASTMDLGSDPGRYSFPMISCIAVDPSDSNVVYAGEIWGGQFFSQPSGVFRSADGGRTWTRMTGFLVAFTTALAIDPSGIPVYVGTPYGVFEYSDDTRPAVSFRR